MDRPTLALISATAFFVATFGVRSMVMWRTTGTTGFRGISGKVASLEWFGGVGFAVAVALILGAPFAETGGFVAPIRPPSRWLDVVALVLMATGAVGTWWSQSAMGASWRIGVDDDEQTGLVNAGPFRWVRNPVFAFLMVSLIGFVTYLSNAVSVVAIAVAAFSLEIQVRYVEEPYLRRTHGDAYRRYERRVGRFVPLLGRAR